MFNLKKTPQHWLIEKVHDFTSACTAYKVVFCFQQILFKFSDLYCILLDAIVYEIFMNVKIDRSNITSILNIKTVI